ncbi:MAG: EAL domain-containing protein [Pseudomonadota bacterium]
MNQKKIHGRNINILCVEDNPADQYLIAELFGADPRISVTMVDRLSPALECLGREHFDAVLLDLSLPDSIAVDSYLRIRNAHEGVPVVIHSGNCDENTAMEAVRQGAQDYIIKGTVNASELTRTFRHAIERQKTRAQLRDSEIRFRRLYDNVLAGVFQIDPEHVLTAANSQMIALLGYHDEQDLLSASLEFEIFSTRDAYWNFVAELKTHEKVDAWELQLRRKDGIEIVVLMGATAELTQTGDIASIEGTFVNITKRKEAEREIQHLAQFDTLTGLANRHLFCDSVNRAFSRAERADSQIGLLFLDLDHFKEVNDTLGHDAGDDLLKTVAQRMSGCLRESDLLSRLGGDEFSVLIQNVKDGGELAKIANKLLNALAEPFTLLGHQVYVTPSIGIATTPEAGSSLEELMKAADVAMYRAKAAGRNRFEFYSGILHAEVVERMRLETDLKAAAKDKLFTLHFQPQVNSNTQAIVSFEALLRFEQNGNSAISPDRFVPILESAGLIGEVGAWVIDESLAQLKKWRTDLDLPELVMNVNVSTHQLGSRSELRDVVKECLDRHGLEPAALELEITEGVLMADVEDCIKTLSGLRDLGVRIVIDDFGTGFSSLQYLTRLPINGLKVDRSFLQGVPENQDSSAIIEATIAMSNRLGLSVTLEGIETRQQAAFAHVVGSEYAQGFYYSKPMHPANVERFIDKHKAKQGKLQIRPKLHAVRPRGATPSIGKSLPSTVRPY